MPEKIFLDKTQCEKVNQLIRIFKDYDPKGNFFFGTISDEIKDELIAQSNDIRIDQVFGVLDALKLKSGYHLLGFKAGLYNFKICLAIETTTEDGQSEIIAEGDIIDFIDVPFTPQGIWQALIMKDISELVMPLGDHRNYDRITYILKKCKFPSKGCVYELFWKGSFYVKKSLLPHLWLDEDSHKGEISVCIWNDWHGLVQATIPFTWDKGKLIFEQAKMNTLLEFNCGVCF